ncbi:MAG: hypothetical protein HXX20_15895 [Chloroflexi bacterium]|nr:hypothetical protein [Chloroflexota bacterium]
MPDENEHTSPIDPLTIGELISIIEASKLSGFSHVYLKEIAGSGRLRAKKMGRDWFTTMEAIAEFKKSRSFKNIPKKYRNKP